MSLLNRVVLLILCLTIMSFGAAVNCEDFDVENCALHHCYVGVASGNPVCKNDPCFSNTINPTTALDSVDCGTVSEGSCRRVSFVDTAGNNADFCVLNFNHFSDCKLATYALEDLFDDSTPANLDASLAAMEQYCSTTLKCGGLVNFWDTANNDFFQCDVPGGDGNLDPTDFDTQNCKYFEYTVQGSNCDSDPCMGKSDADCDAAAAQCSKITIGGSNFCVTKGRSFSQCAYNWGESITPDQCAAGNCGELRSAVSKRGKTYYYCSEPSAGSCPAGYSYSGSACVENCGHSAGGSYCPTHSTCTANACVAETGYTCYDTVCVKTSGTLSIHIHSFALFSIIAIFIFFF